MKIGKFLRFNDESCFDGSVQSDWFYDRDKAAAVSASYVFHGKRYFGVKADDVSPGQHQLMDTVSFTIDVLNRTNSLSTKSNLLLTIAGYGTGKSHLSVTLGNLLSGHDTDSRASIIKNISDVESKDAIKIEEECVGKNLVIVLNGMRNYNLDYEVLRCVGESLKLHGESVDQLQKLSKAYIVAHSFLERSYDTLSERFAEAAQQYRYTQTGAELFDFLSSKLDVDMNVFDIINNVYKTINGDNIAWDKGISAGDVLTFIANEFCGGSKKYQKVIILFDEFGRYLEYSASNPQIAGESSLQQIYESVQNSNGKIIFIGFIQSDLSTYKARIEKSSNIDRYIGRFDLSDKYYLSSNLETVLANLIIKTDEITFRKVVTAKINQYFKFYSKMHNQINRWCTYIKAKSVWTNNDMFFQTVVNGCYPLHPLTVCLLSSMADWLQQRSSISFVKSKFRDTLNVDAGDGWLPYILPIDIVDSSLFDDMVNSEDRGLIQSQQCLLYKNIMSAFQNKLSENENKILKAITLFSSTRFKFLDRSDYNIALGLACSLTNEEVEQTVKSLEDLHGVIAFDDNSNQFDMLVETSGLNDFKRIYARHRISLRNFEGIRLLREDVIDTLDLSTPIETSFAAEHSISAADWHFDKELIPVEDFTETYCERLVNITSQIARGVNGRGIIVYLYSQDFDKYLQDVLELSKKFNLDKKPILILVIEDSDNIIIEAIRVLEVIRLFSSDEKERFPKYITSYERAYLKKIEQTFISLSHKRMIVTSGMLTTYSDTIRTVCNQKFNAIYTIPVPFVFDGFEKRIGPKVLKLHADICISLFDGSLTDSQTYSGQLPEFQNRVKSLLYSGSGAISKGSWGVFANGHILVASENKVIREIIDEVWEELNTKHDTTIKELFYKYSQAPYGMDCFALTTLILYFLAFYQKRLIVNKSLSTEIKLKAIDLKNEIFLKDRLYIEKLFAAKIVLKAEDYFGPILRLCEEICINTDASKCNDYNDQMQHLLDQEGDVSDYIDRINSARYLIEKGIDFYAALTKPLLDAEQLCMDIETRFSLVKCCRAIQNCNKCLSHNKTSEQYIPALDYLDRVKCCHSLAIDLLDKRASTFIDGISCNITELAKLKIDYSKIPDFLVSIGKSDLGERLINKLTALENDLLIEQKYASVIAQCNNYLSLIGDVSKFSYEQCRTESIELNRWVSYFETVDDFPTKQKVEFLREIKNYLEAINLRGQYYIQEECALRNDIKAFSSSSDVDALLKRICSIISEKISEELTIEFSQYREMLNLFKEQWLISVDDRKLLASMLLSAENDPRCIPTWVAIQQRYCTLLAVINSEQEQWLEENINSQRPHLSQMTAEQCVTWDKRMASLPAFLDEESRVLVQRCREQVEVRLKECRVDGVISMFNELSKDEKEICFEKLKDYMNC